MRKRVYRRGKVKVLEGQLTLPFAVFDDALDAINEANQERGRKEEKKRAGLNGKGDGAGLSVNRKRGKL